MEKSIKPRHSPCFFNFILYANGESVDTYLKSVVERISGEYPCNVILLHEEMASRKEDLPLLLFPRLKSDLPTYLLWAEDPAKFALPGMENYLTKIIFDSSLAPHLPSFAKAALESPYPFGDLNWNRIEQWQQLFAEQFNRNDKLALIEHAKKISIFYKGFSQIQALYLQAWIAMKLQWQFLSFEENLLQYMYKGNVIDIALIPEEESTLSEGRILAVHIESEYYGEMKFARNPEKPYIATIEQFFPNYCEMPATYFFDEERFGRSLSLEVCRRGTQKSLYQTLNALIHYATENLCV